LKKLSDPRIQALSISIAVVNHSTKVTDVEVQPVVAALQKQLDRDFMPLWGFSAKLYGPLPGGQPVPDKTFWQLVLLDDSDQAGALGYHDLTPNGMPLGKVFVAEDMKYGQSWTVTASHELTELLVDPLASLCVYSGGVMFAYEVSDACQDDQWAYDIDGVKVSDFVTPNWFKATAPSNARFDFGRHIKKPFEILSGGYIGVFHNGFWTTIDNHGRIIPPKPGRRTERRARWPHGLIASAI
jgi:hypothetical protein